MFDFDDFKNNFETLFLIFVFIFAAIGFTPFVQYILGY